MLFEQQERLEVQHFLEYLQGKPTLSVDHSCEICYPVPEVVTVLLKNFWDWIKSYHHRESFTLYTVQALHIYCILFNQDPNTNKSNRVVDTAIKLLLSIKYTIRPISFPDILYYFLNFTNLTNYFRSPLTPELITNFNTINTE